MAQWEKIKHLDAQHLEKVSKLYEGSPEFPMDVRQYLAQWIEGQDWLSASKDPYAASLLFQVLLENLDHQQGRFAQEQEGESFLILHKFRGFKHNFQEKYQEEPCKLADIILWYLNEEKEILQSAQLAEQVQSLQVQENSMEDDSQRNIERKMSELRKKVQDMEHNIRFFEDRQDEFYFKYQTRAMGEQTEILKLRLLLNDLDKSRKDVLSGMGALLEAAEELLGVLVRDELNEWQRRQQSSCIGAPEEICLNQLESWFTLGAQCLFQLRNFLCKIDELQGKVEYERDPFLSQKPGLERRLNSLLTELLKSAFVVETQPAMPQGKQGKRHQVKGPLVLQTNKQFSVRTRLLAKVPELNHAIKVTVSIDGDAPQVNGFRRFNLLGDSSKVLDMAESTSGGMVADFRYLKLKEQKAGGGRGGNDSFTTKARTQDEEQVQHLLQMFLSVTEELHIFNFETVFELHGLSVTLLASSLPVVIISNESQQQNAWASVLWFNMLCSDTKDVGFFGSSPVATWPQLAQVLNWQFLSTTKRGLNDDQLNMIAQKLFGKQQSYEACRIPWARFSKEMFAGNNFTFWAWIDGILDLVKTYFENLWNDGCIMGFVSKVRTDKLLKRKPTGTFLLRFSESTKDGGITFSWVEHYLDDGEETANIRSVTPFTEKQLSQVPFAEIIRNYFIVNSKDVHEYPLTFLYPNIPKGAAFGKHYTVKNGAYNPFLDYLQKMFLFMSEVNTLEAKSPMNTLSDPEAMAAPVDGPCVPHSAEAAVYIVQQCRDSTVSWSHPWPLSAPTPSSLPTENSSPSNILVGEPVDSNLLPSRCPAPDDPEPSPDDLEPSPDDLEPSLDDLELSLDLETSLNDLEPSPDDPEPSLDDLEPSPDDLEPSRRPGALPQRPEPSSTTWRPPQPGDLLDDLEPSLDLETSLNDLEPSLDLETSLNDLEPSLDLETSRGLQDFLLNANDPMMTSDEYIRGAEEQAAAAHSDFIW
ncbi:hypothetical protein AAFF_G00158640 [Aldrovandia affinis]|uniref:Signal transducer and activator of transcription n=1 Tax=Aldrovandia affinis TaxID=143900 RepID=A0AAD7RMX9_9TELE|nr:hypothetical protein AAFF_G00158640 [Aldrovandia affinis]